MPQFSMKDLVKISEGDTRDATYKDVLFKGSFEINL